MKEKFENYILYGILIIAIVTLVFAFTGFTGNISKETTKEITVNKIKNTESGFKSIVSGSTNDGEVSIELTPHKIVDGKLNVDISVNTHSVNLDQFDLKKITILEYNGKTINPVSATTLNGHHNSGNLIFEVEEDIDSFTIKIKNIPKIEERVFKWN